MLDAILNSAIMTVALWTYLDSKGKDRISASYWVIVPLMIQNLLILPYYPTISKLMTLGIFILLCRNVAKISGERAFLRGKRKQ